MADFPTVKPFPGGVISPVSPEAPLLGPFTSLHSTWGSAAAWPTANTAFYIPFSISVPLLITQIFWINGSTVGTNHVDAGIYDAGGNKVISTGSTLTAGVSVAQVVDITDTLLSPGQYFLAMVMDGTTDTILRWGGSATISAAGGQMKQATAFTLPTTATFVNNGNTAYTPAICLTTKTVV